MIACTIRSSRSAPRAGARRAMRPAIARSRSGSRAGLGLVGLHRPGQRGPAGQQVAELGVDLVDQAPEEGERLLARARPGARRGPAPRWPSRRCARARPGRGGRRRRGPGRSARRPTGRSRPGAASGPRRAAQCRPRCGPRAVRRRGRRASPRAAGRSRRPALALGHPDLVVGQPVGQPGAHLGVGVDARGHRCRAAVRPGGPRRPRRRRPRRRGAAAARPRHPCRSWEGQPQSASRITSRAWRRSSG